MPKQHKTFKVNTNALVVFSVLVILIGTSFVFPRKIFNGIDQISIIVRDMFGQFYLILGLAFVVFMLLIGLLPLGQKRLGSTKPVYSFWSWVAMLYSAGMGAGILFRAVQEPIFMYLNPPMNVDTSPKIMALEYTFFQWGFTAWAFYTVFALIIGHLIFNRNESVQLSNLFSKSYPKIFKVSINGFTILTTLVGIVSAVAIGVQQIRSSAQLLMDIPDGFVISIVLVLFIILLSTTSSLLGLDKGIKHVSNFNIFLTILLLLFVFLQSDMLDILENLSVATATYVKDFVPMSLAYGDYNPGKAFLTDWTYYYWAFWLAWAPFTGVFIARISRGRSFRQIVFGSLLVPSIASFFWFSVFGSSAIEMVDTGIVSPTQFDSAFTALSVFLNQYQFHTLTQILVIVLLFGFLITSLDSGLFVLSMFSDNGKKDPLNSHKITWALISLLLSLGFLYIGYAMPEEDVLSAVSKILIIASLPFAFLSLLMIWRFIKQVK